MNCLWHECDKEFAPDHHLQRFCSKACQSARANWKARRGSALVDPLLDGKLADLETARDKMKREIEECLKSKCQPST